MQVIIASAAAATKAKAAAPAAKQPAVTLAYSAEDIKQATQKSIAAENDVCTLLHAVQCSTPFLGSHPQSVAAQLAVCSPL